MSEKKIVLSIAAAAAVAFTAWKIRKSTGTKAAFTVRAITAADLQPSDAPGVSLSPHRVERPAHAAGFAWAAGQVDAVLRQVVVLQNAVILTTDQLKADVKSKSMVDLANRGFLLRGALDLQGLYKLVAQGAVLFVAVRPGPNPVLLGHSVFTGADEFLGYYEKAVNPNAHGVLVPRGKDGLEVKEQAATLMDWSSDRILANYVYLYQIVARLSPMDSTSTSEPRFRGVGRAMFKAALDHFNSPKSGRMLISDFILEPLPNLASHAYHTRMGLTEVAELKVGSYKEFKNVRALVMTQLTLPQ